MFCRAHLCAQALELCYDSKPNYSSRRRFNCAGEPIYMRQFRQEHVLQLLTVLRTRENVKRGEANDEAQRHLEIMPKLGEKLSQLMTGFGDALKKKRKREKREGKKESGDVPPRPVSCCCYCLYFRNLPPRSFSRSGPWHRDSC